MLIEPYCCLFEGVDSRFRGNDRRQVLKDAKLQPKPQKNLPTIVTGTRAAGFRIFSLLQEIIYIFTLDFFPRSAL